MYSDLVSALQQDYFKDYHNCTEPTVAMPPQSRPLVASGSNDAKTVSHQSWDLFRPQHLMAVGGEARLHSAPTKKQRPPPAGIYGSFSSPRTPHDTLMHQKEQHVSSGSSLWHGVVSHRRLDRSHSEPLQQQQMVLLQNSSSPSSQCSRYKTELCRPYEESGRCRYGDKCQFAHGTHELRVLSRHPKYKTDLCRTFHTTGYCPYGARCHFVHNSAEQRRPLDLPLSSTTANTGCDMFGIGNGRSTLDDVSSLLPAFGSSMTSNSIASTLSPSPIDSLLLSAELETLSLGSAGSTASVSSSPSPPIAPLSPLAPASSLPVFSRLRRQATAAI